MVQIFQEVNKMLYWIMMFCIGGYIYLYPKVEGAIDKLNVSYPKNLYVGGIIMIISGIIILIKLFVLWKNK